jgi:hypothetical protein
LEKWSTFATIAGGAAAGLTGLLFVAVSIRVGVIAKSQELRNRAAQTLALFVTVLFIAILVSILRTHRRPGRLGLARRRGSRWRRHQRLAAVDKDPGVAPRLAPRPHQFSLP